MELPGHRDQPLMKIMDVVILPGGRSISGVEVLMCFAFSLLSLLPAQLDDHLRRLARAHVDAPEVKKA